MDNIFYEIIFIFNDGEQLIFSSKTTPIVIQEHSKLTSSTLNFENFGKEYDSVIRISTNFNAPMLHYNALKTFCENIAKKKETSEINNIIIKNSNDEEYFNYNANQIVEFSSQGTSENINNSMTFHYILNIFVKG